jgi:amino acid permease
MKYGYENSLVKPELHEDLTYFNWSGLPLFFGVAVFEFEGNNVIINLHDNMKNPEHFTKVLVSVLSFYVMLVVSFSSLVYYVSFATLLPFF